MRRKSAQFYHFHKLYFLLFKLKNETEKMGDFFKKEIFKKAELLACGMNDSVLRISIYVKIGTMK